MQPIYLFRPQVKSVFKAFLALFLIFSFQGAFAQEISLKEPFAPTPNAGAFGKYSDIPVSHFTGVPNISIPLYTVTDGGVSLPISLSYHSSGVQVSEMSSWVGLGWSLNAGGVITRTVVGAPDDGASGFLNNPYYCGQNNNLPPATSGYYTDKTTTDAILGLNCLNCFSTEAQNGLAYAYKAHLGEVDSEPDVYSYNFGGYSGKFVFDRNGKVNSIPKNDLKIVPLMNGRFYGWIITTPDGTRYHFGNAPNSVEESFGFANVLINPANGNDALEFLTSITGANLNTELDTKQLKHTSWYLVKIESFDTESAINLEYESEEFGYFDRNSHTAVYINDLSSTTPNFNSSHVYQGVNSLEAITPS